MEVQSADQPEMDVDQLVGGKADEQVFPGGFGSGQDGAVKERCSICKSPLRTADPHLFAGETGIEFVGQAKEGVPLRHPASALGLIAAGAAGRR